MANLSIGDIVTRKSYGGDIYFKITDIILDENKEPVYVLKGLQHRLNADSLAVDLEKQEPRNVLPKIEQDIRQQKKNISNPLYRFRWPFFARLRARSGKILHLDADEGFLNTCLGYYKEAGIVAVGRLLSESEQPSQIRSLLQRYQPDILVATGHDSLKKDSGNLYTLNNYANSTYFVESVKEARKYEPDPQKLFVFAGACQSYYEAITSAGANFASSPGRVLINALDPSYVANKVALTAHTSYVTPESIARITKSGRDGIWGTRTRGHFISG